MAWFKTGRLQAESLSVGEVIRPPMFVSTSTSKNVAKGFKDIFMVQFTIVEGCPNACFLGVSEFRHEKEVLLTPYTPLAITRVEGDQIDVVVIDSLLWMDAERESKKTISSFPDLSLDFHQTAGWPRALDSTCVLKGLCGVLCHHANGRECVFQWSP